jgi:hypothetical protein
LLFQAVVRAAAGTDNEQLRANLGDLADLCWSRLTGGHAPDPLTAFGENTQPNWHNIFCVVDTLVTAVDVAAGGPTRARVAVEFVYLLLSEAEATHRDLASSDPGNPALPTIEAQLTRARSLLATRPGLAAAQLYQCLTTLEQLNDSGTATPSR